MTSLAFILGMVPLVIASGAGAASRIAVGSGVMGGMIAATLLGIFFIPLFYLSVRKWLSRKRPPAPAEKGHHEEPGHAQADRPRPGAKPCRLRQHGAEARPPPTPPPLPNRKTSGQGKRRNVRVNHG